MTAVAGAVFAAADFNTFARDNLNETMVSKATTPGSIFAGNGANAVSERTPDESYVGTSSTTTSTTYADLAAGAGPSLTLNTGPTALICLYCTQYNTSGTAAWMAFDITGATAFSASDSYAVQLQGTGGQKVGAMFLYTVLTAGSNTFTAKYRVSTSGTGTFSARRLSVWSF